MRIASSIVLCFALSAPVYAGVARPSPNSRNDDSPVVREVKRVVKAVKALGHLIVAPLGEGPDVVWPKP